MPGAADSGLSPWGAHPDRTNARNTVIEGQLTRFMPVNICGHYEMEILEIVSRSVQESGGEGVASHVVAMLERRVPIHPDALKGILRGFGGGCLDRFRQGAGPNDLLRYRASQRLCGKIDLW